MLQVNYSLISKCSGKLSVPSELNDFIEFKNQEVNKGKEGKNKKVFLEHSWLSQSR